MLDTFADVLEAGLLAGSSDIPLSLLDVVEVRGVGVNDSLCLSGDSEDYG